MLLIQLAGRCGESTMLLIQLAGRCDESTIVLIQCEHRCRVEAVEGHGMNEAAEMMLKQMKADLAALDREAEELERKRARLRQGILVLRQTLGNKPGSGESLTDAILDQVKGAVFSLTAAQAADCLRVCGFEVTRATVATILSRLLKAGQLKKNAENSGYVWAGIVAGEEEPQG
jgi:hypothetical protein